MTRTTTIREPIASQPAFADILKSEFRYASGQSQGRSEKMNGWFDQLVVQSGADVHPSVLVLLSLFCAIAIGGTVFVLQENLLSTALGAIIGFGVPIAILILIRSRRQTMILRQLPAMISELARAARTGRSLEQCLHLVANDTPNPLGGELQLAARRMALGLSVDDALRDLPERTGVQTLNVLVTALSVHQRTGGDLVSVLDRLASTTRDRISFLGRLRAQTAASRATSLLMITLPIGVLAFFAFRDPTYFTRLMQSNWGRYATILAIILQILGSIWVVRILRVTARS